jgi:hypothetical protein
MVETTIPLLSQACAITLPMGSAGGSSSTVAGSGAGGGSGAPPPGVGDDDTGNCDGQDSHAVEPARTGGNMGSGHGRFVTHGGRDRRQGGGLGNGRFVRDRGDDSGACHPKITFPPFDGEGDPLHWLNKCSIYFRGMGTPTDERVWMASLHLDGVAAEWYYALERDLGSSPGSVSLNSSI